MNLGSAPLYLDRDVHGSIVTEGWEGIMSAGTVGILVLFGSLKSDDLEV